MLLRSDDFFNVSGDRRMKLSNEELIADSNDDLDRFLNMVLFYSNLD